MDGMPKHLPALARDKAPRPLRKTHLQLLGTKPRSGSEGSDEHIRSRDAELATYYHVGAMRGDAAAQTNLGVLYAKGQGVPQDYSQAFAWFSKAADQGYAVAEYHLGRMYSLGKGVRQDYAQAAVRFRKAADEGDATAQTSLGELYLKGLGVTQDVVQALKWFILAAKDNRQRTEWGTILTTRMTSAQIADAQRLAREWTTAFEQRPTKRLIDNPTPW